MPRTNPQSEAQTTTCYNNALWLTLRHAGSGRRARHTSILLYAGEYLE